MTPDHAALLAILRADDDPETMAANIVADGWTQATRRDRVHVYKDKKGEWRWRLRAANGRIIANSGEGYINRSHAIRMAEQVNPIATLIDHEAPEVEP